MIERGAGAAQSPLAIATPAFDEAKRVEDIYEAEERAAEDAFTRGFYEAHVRQINVQVQAWELAAQAQSEHFDTHSTTSSYVTLPLQIDGAAGTLLTVFVQTGSGWMLLTALFQTPGAAGIQIPVERISVEVI